MTNSMHIEQPASGSLEVGNGSTTHDDDGRLKRTGTWLTASAHIVTAVIGSGVLSLAWAIAQLGWLTGPAVLIAFAFITFITSAMLADSYRCPGPIHGNRNYTYTEVVRSHLGDSHAKFCAMSQYGNAIGVTIGYTITASVSMVAMLKSICFHEYGEEANCEISNYPYMIIFAVIQIVLSQIPEFHELSWLSVVAAITSFTYAGIGLALCAAKLFGEGIAKTTLTGTIVGVDVAPWDKIWNSLQAIGDIAFAYAFSTVLIEIQDTLKSQPPESNEMKKASIVGVLITTFFYVLCGVVGYAAFGNNAPGNFLTGFGHFEPFWIIGFANVCIVVHLIGAYQVFAQPLFGYVEKRCSMKWPESKFITEENQILERFSINVFRLMWRTAYVMFTAVVAMMFPFFNGFVGLIGAASFYPLTVYFPIEMHIAQTKIPKYSVKWIWLKALSWACLVVSVVAAAGSIQGLWRDVSRNNVSFHE